jgi:hypothetical protein
VLEFEPEWLFEVAPEYFSLDEDFKNGEARRKLERVKNRIEGK